MTHADWLVAYQRHVRELTLARLRPAAVLVATRKFIYDLWGDAVNTASRMESHGSPGAIQISEATRDRLGDSFELEDRGTVDVKGKGAMRTWFLKGRKKEDAAVA